jgi:hypothetical protein
MPVRKEFRHLYRGQEWKRTRARLLKRAGNRCEFCGRPNRKLVLVTLGGEWWDEDASCWRRQLSCTTAAVGPHSYLRDRHGQPCEPVIKGLARRIRVVLQCAHLNHSPGDDSNLAALCGRCHLNFDRSYHADVRKLRKDRSRQLLAALAPASQSQP